MEKFEQLLAKMETAWNAGDYETWASVFAPDAEFVNIYGAHRTGRDHIRDSHKRIFGGIYKDSHNVFTLERVRSIAPKVTGLLVFSKLVHKTGGHDARMVMIVDETSGAPLITWFHNCLVAEPRPR